MMKSCRLRTGRSTPLKTPTPWQRCSTAYFRSSACSYRPPNEVSTLSIIRHQGASRLIDVKKAFRSALARGPPLIQQCIELRLGQSQAISPPQLHCWESVRLRSNSKPEKQPGLRSSPSRLRVRLGSGCNANEVLWIDWRDVAMTIWPERLPVRAACANRGTPPRLSPIETCPSVCAGRLADRRHPAKKLRWSSREDRRARSVAHGSEGTHNGRLRLSMTRCGRGARMLPVRQRCAKTVS